MITNSIQSANGEANHWIGNNCSEFRNELLDSDFRKRMFGTLFLDSRFQNYPDSVMLQKYHSHSNQNFKHNLAHMTSLDLTPKLSFEPRFRMFTINDYDRKSNHS